VRELGFPIFFCQSHYSPPFCCSTSTQRHDTQKLENAQKLGVLSLSEHNLDDIPSPVFGPELARKLRTLDLSKNNLHKNLDQLGSLTELKILNLDKNNLPAGSLNSIEKLQKLQNLSVAGNQLGKPAAASPQQQKSSSCEPLPAVLPASLKQLNLSSNFFSSIPRSVVSPNLSKLEKLDLSFNQLATVPQEICHLVKLEELRLDSNSIVSLPSAMGQLTKLKALSLRDNHIQVTGTLNDTTNPQPLPQSLFTDTLLIDLNLHGNRGLTNTQLNTFDGFQEFLDRRQKVKSKTMTNLDVCGLE